MLKQIRDSNPPVDTTQLISFARRHSFVLPTAYRTFLMNSNGGQPVQAAFTIQSLPNNPYGIIQAFFGINANLRTEDLDTILAELSNVIPKCVLPIACTDGDDFVCLDLRSTERVVFWDRRYFWGSSLWRNEDLYFVAASFTSFLQELREP